MCLTFGVVFVLGPRGGGQATWFLDERVFDTVFPYQSEAGRSRLFDINTSGYDVPFCGYECEFL